MLSAFVGRCDFSGTILAKCPDISTAMVEMTLKAMLDEGTISKTGGGRSTAYVRNN